MIRHIHIYIASLSAIITFSWFIWHYPRAGKDAHKIAPYLILIGMVLLITSLFTANIAALIFWTGHLPRNVDELIAVSHGRVACTFGAGAGMACAGVVIGLLGAFGKRGHSKQQQ